MRFSDYHLHTEYSFDSTEKIENICKKAVKENIAEIALTDHLEMQDKEYPDFAVREKEIALFREIYNGEVSIKSGVEIGQPHYDLKLAGEMIEVNDFDFILASLHTVKEYGPPSKYPFTENNVCDYLKRYLSELEIIAEQAEYDVLAHVTLPFRYIPEELKKIAPIGQFENQYRQIFKVIVKRGKGIEINASGMRTLIKQTLPSEEVLKWYEAEGGNIITLGSDGHSIRSAFSGLGDALRAMRSTTINKIAHYTKRSLSFEKLESKGEII